MYDGVLYVGERLMVSFDAIDATTGVLLAPGHRRRGDVVAGGRPGPPACSSPAATPAPHVRADDGALR